MAHALLEMHLQKAVMAAAKLDEAGRRAMQEFFAAALDYERTYAAKARSLVSYTARRDFLDGIQAKAKAAAVRQSAERLKPYGVNLMAFAPEDLAQAVSEMYSKRTR